MQKTREVAPAKMMATARGTVPLGRVLKSMVAPIRPNSSGHMMKRQNQRTCFSTLRARCGPCSPAPEPGCCQARLVTGQAGRIITAFARGRRQGEWAPHGSKNFVKWGKSVAWFARYDQRCGQDTIKRPHREVRYSVIISSPSEQVTIHGRVLSCVVGWATCHKRHAGKHAATDF